MMAAKKAKEKAAKEVEKRTASEEGGVGGSVSCVCVFVCV
jgi:hypothetical protein